MVARFGVYLFLVARLGWTQTVDQKQPTESIRFAPASIAKMVRRYRVPVYPVASLQANKGGLAVASLKIGVDGKVESANVYIAPDEHIKQATAEALRDWTFQPAKLAGIAHPARARILLYFQNDVPGGKVVIPDVTDKSK